MKNKGWIAILLIVALCFCFACSAPAASAPAGETAAAPGKKPVVNIAYTAIADTFDPSTNVGIAEAITMSQVYDTLFEKDLSGDLRPSLGKEYKVSEDGLTYTVTLQEGVKWSDGTPFTAEDVKATFEYYAKRPAIEWFYAKLVKETNVLNDRTVEIVLSAPNSAFISYMGLSMYSAILQKAALDKYGDKIGSDMESIVGTGPYTVTKWDHDVAITYKAKEDYFRGVVSVKNLVFHQITDINAAMVALQTGELDVLYNPVTGTAYKTLSADPKIKIEEFESCRNEGYYMYTRSGLFSDVRMRQAVAYAVSKEDVMAVTVEGMGKTIQYPGDIGSTMTGNPDFTPSITYHQDLEKARSLVKEAGKEGAEIVVKSYNTEPYATMGTYLQSVLQEIGLNARVEQMERGTFIDQLVKEQVIILPFCWVGSAYDIDEVLGASLHSANVGSSANYSFYEDPEMDKMVEEARAASDIEVRKELYKQIVEKFMKDVPFVSLYAVKYAIAHNAELVTDNPISYSVFNYQWAQ